MSRPHLFIVFVCVLTSSMFHHAISTTGSTITDNDKESPFGRSFVFSPLDICDDWQKIKAISCIERVVGIDMAWECIYAYCVSAHPTTYIRVKLPAVNSP